VATYEGRITAHNITSSALVSPDYRAMPFSLYTVSNLASVGLSEDAARKQGREFSTVFHNLADQKSTIIAAEEAAYSKVLIDDRTNHVVGAQIIGHRAEELINIFSLAMWYGITAKDLHVFAFAFPTFTSDIPGMTRLPRSIPLPRD
jgi:glutathione reductase (NADPH)